ncbi:MAG: hypothetical protein ACPLSN_03720 [Dictyoglomus turgidum]
MRVEVRFWLKNNIVIIDARTTLDAILAGAKYRSLISQGVSSREASTCIEHLPFHKFRDNNIWFYMTSLPEYTPVMVDRHIYVRKQNTMRYREILPGETVGKIIDNGGLTDSGLTPYAMVNHCSNAILTESVSFVADIDVDVLEKVWGKDVSSEDAAVEGIKEIMESIPYIGSRGRIGYGVVERVSVRKTGKKIRRYVPLGIKGLNYSYPCITIRPIPPYWLKEGACLCAISEF